MIHELPILPYSYNALEPDIDEKTMQIHHDKHHQTYVNKLNEALNNYPDLQILTLEELLKSLKTIPKEIRDSIRHNGGGHYNHSFFWKIMESVKGGEPKGGLAVALNDKFKNFQKFKEKFSKKAANLFGSGWVWLILDKNGNPKIISTDGHDNPVMKGLTPLLVIDLWEHAYYLKYQNRRPEYIEAWWNTVNWDEAEKYYQEAKSKEIA